MRRSAAFTLVELLVALAITAILVLLLASVVAATLSAWNQGRNRLDTYSNARQILGRLGDELKGAVTNPAVSGSQIQFVENADLAAVPSPTPGTAENVFFVAPYPNLGAGDLCTIAYALDPATHELKRAFRSSDQVWADPVATRYQAAGHAYAAADWHVVATGVLEFELQCYSQNDLDTNVTPPGVTWNSESADVYMAGKAPRRIVIRLQAVDDRTLAQLAGMTIGSVPYTAIVLRATRQFTAEVSLPPP
jgi:prepilin-type N-terminal cleavage/methylation domain-containing protein